MMRYINLPAPGDGLDNRGRAISRLNLLLSVAAAACLVGGNNALAQDIDNTLPLTNSVSYAGDVLSNTGSIDNNGPAGVWIGNVLSNAGDIRNNVGADWLGDVSNTGSVVNRGIWTGQVLSNAIGTIVNSGSTALWTGDVISADSQIVNQDGATWRGDVLGNNNAILNKEGSFWIGDVVANGGGTNTEHSQVVNRGDWTGDIIANMAGIYNDDGVWTGNVQSNASAIGNNFQNTAVTAEWVGDIWSNDDRIFNFDLGLWQGNLGHAVLAAG